MAARRSAALARAEKALAGARKRASILRTKIRKDQPMEIAMTIAGGGIHGAVTANTPDILKQVDVDPGLLVGGVLVGYGLMSTKAGQMEKAATAVGTGMLAAFASRYVESQI